jgi:hypothetical protein
MSTSPRPRVSQRGQSLLEYALVVFLIVAVATAGIVFWLQ